MAMRLTGVMGVAALVVTAGCEEFEFSDPPTTEQESYRALQDETLALRDATEDLVLTPVAELPTLGTATYAGTALIALDAPEGGVASELIGTARITADFEASTLGGDATGFHGTVNGGEVSAFEGQIFVAQGLIDRTGTGDQIGADVNGALQGGGDTLVVDGTLGGNFLGDPLLLNEAPEALSMDTGDGTTFRLNGEAVAGGMEIIATD